MAFPRLVRTTDSPSAGALQERSDDDLMTLSQAGHREAFTALLTRHAERVVNLCSRFVNDGPLGRELAQDTWVLVWQGRQKYRAEGAFVRWLVTVARNHCRNHVRRNKTASDIGGDIDDVADLLPNSAEQLDALLIEERRRRVRRALSELAAPMREALLLRYAEGLRYDEMTSIAGTGESTLRSRVHHGLKLLKEKLERDS
ncbi:MAG TPA: RNA polymerase sigma factor [Polyangiaceae bacterium]|nr:RNA polymerase sigma factor [Polyangiaceae bacterium]